MKKFAMIVFLICVALITTSCNSTKVFYYGSNFGNEIKATYTYFTGTEKKNIGLKEGDVLRMEYESVVNEGTLTLSLLIQTMR
ncbi:hypothetical protein H1D32_16515 [Anaerobacillus sp. CMMVII]|uniref:hypothetical protein n=1 Tax=Anaerobacillus sp. CMMVII TaxID=2755588 RepID=UPI0021B72D3C|nr:hypothetical protein [Anaerobacillus sp. CMMVII]MCT8139166.1 hypothetical protein [Anaerobacillus sp. CMMVII]